METTLINKDLLPLVATVYYFSVKGSLFQELFVCLSLVMKEEMKMPEISGFELVSIYPIQELLSKRWGLCGWRVTKGMI